MNQLHNELDAVDQALSFQTVAFVRRGMLHRRGFGLDAVKDLWEWVEEFTSSPAGDGQVMGCIPVAELLKVDEDDCGPAGATLAKMIGIMAKAGGAEMVTFTD